MDRQTVSYGGWQVTQPAGSHGDACAVEPGTAPGGQDALRLSVHPREASEAVEQHGWPVEPGRAYVLSAQVRTALANAHGQLRLRWLAADGAVIREDVSGFTFLEHDYAPLRVWALAPDGAVQACAGLRLAPACPDMTPPSGALWLAPSQFAPSLLLDASPRATAALFDAGLPADYFLAVRGAPVSLPQVTVHYVLADYAGGSVAEGVLPVALAGGEGRTTLSLPALPPGYYELALTAEGHGVSRFCAVRTLGVLPLLDFAPSQDNPISLDAGLSWPTDGGANECRAVTAAAACAKVGIRSLRERMSWHAVNPERGRFAWGTYRRNADIQRACGIDVYPVFHDTPEWARVAAADGHRNYPPADPRSVYEFTRRLTLDLGGAVRYFELWNEPDIFFFGGHPWDLAALIKAGCLGIKDADPTVGVLNASRCASAEFWRCLLANGISPYFDIWNQHFYGAPEQLFALIQEDRDLLAAAGIERPIWMTEMGRRSVPAHDGTYAIPERLQVSYLLRAYGCGLASGLDRFMYFYLQEFLEYGVNLWGLQRGSLDPKPAFVALATLIRQLRDAKVLGILQEGKRYGVVFERQPGDCVALVWSLEGSLVADGWEARLPEFAPGQSWAAAEGAFELPVQPGAFVVNAVGERIADLSGPTATVRLSLEPAFVRGVDASRLTLKPVPTPLHFTPVAEPPPAERHVWLQAVSRPGQPLTQAAAQRQKLAVHFAPGQAEEVEFRVHNWSRALIEAKLEMSWPAGWESDTPAQLLLAVAAQETRCVRVRLMPQAGDGQGASSSWLEPRAVHAALTLNGRARDTARVDYVLDLEKAAESLRFACSPLQAEVADIRRAKAPTAALRFGAIAVTPGQPPCFNDIRSFHAGQHGLLYLQATVDRPAAARGAFVFGADASVKVWVNGRAVDCRPDATNPALDGQYSAAVRWRKGTNRIVLALSTNHGKAWGVFGRAAVTVAAPRVRRQP